MFWQAPSEDIRHDLSERLEASRDLLSGVMSALRHEREDTFERMVFAAAELGPILQNSISAEKSFGQISSQKTSRDKLI
jgi:CHASE1-domain containing sensor protein